MTPDPTHLKLGKLPATPSPKDFRLGDFLKPSFELPAKLPTRFGHGDLFKDWEMFGNGPDESVAPGFKGVGDCVFATIAHIIKMVAHLQHRTVTITGKECVQAYSEVTGYVMGDDSTDQGTDMRAAMSWWRQVGFPDAKGNRHKIAAYMAFNPTDYTEHRQVTYLLTANAIGFNFPASAWDQFDQGKPWEYVAGSAPEGGHAVPEVGENRKDEITIVSWGRRVEMNRDFLEHQNDEAWAFVFPEELNSKGFNERGLDLTKLNDALHSLH